MALQLPQQPTDPRVVLPQMPANSPVLADIYRAEKFKRSVIDSAGSNAIHASTPDDVGRAVLYEHAVADIISAGMIGPAPPWFTPVRNQLMRIEQNLATGTNAENNDGNVYPFVVVPFNNGDDPTAGPHHLPVLSSIADIDALLAVDCNRYLTGYGVQHPTGVANVANRRRLVKIAIGC